MYLNECGKSMQNMGSPNPVVRAHPVEGLNIRNKSNPQMMAVRIVAISARMKNGILYYWGNQPYLLNDNDNHN